MSQKKKQASDQEPVATTRGRVGPIVVLNDDGSKTFQKSGTGGTSERTVEGRIHGMKKFDEFLEQKGGSLAIMGSAAKRFESNESLASRGINYNEQLIGLFQEFGTYLVYEAMHNVTGETLSEKTSTQDLSCVHVVVEKYCKDNNLAAREWDLWKRTDGKAAKWYTELAKDVKMRMENRTIFSGKPINKKRNVGRLRILQKCRDSYLKANTRESYVKRFAVLTSYLGSGRSGEVAFCSFNEDTYLDVEEDVLVLFWKEPKTGQMYELSIYPDYEHWELCWYVGLGDCIIVGGQSDSRTSPVLSSANWIFPAHASLKLEGAAAAMILEEKDDDNQPYKNKLNMYTISVCLVK